MDTGDEHLTRPSSVRSKMFEPLPNNLVKGKSMPSLRYDCLNRVELFGFSWVHFRVSLNVQPSIFSITTLYSTFYTH